MKDKSYLVIAGPTGSGKSDLALGVAERLNGEIVGCDSVQLYRGFDIGSAKPTAAERARVPHHLIDRLAWDEDCDAALYAQWAKAEIAAILARGRLPIIVGGTGLYLRALLGSGWSADLPKSDTLRAELETAPTPELFERLRRLDPVRASEIHANDRFRVVRSLELVTLLGKPLREAGMTAAGAPDANAYVLVLDPDRAELHRRIALRTKAMLAAGLLDEVRALLAAGVARTCKPMGSIGYLEAGAVLEGLLPLASFEEAVVVATRRYAKRQCTWNRKVVAEARLSTWTVDSVVQALSS